MLIREIMTRKVIMVSMDDSIEEVAKLLIENRIHALPVVEGGKPVGIVTETDFFTGGSMKIYLPEYIGFVKKERSLDGVNSEEKRRMELLVGTKVGDIMSYPCVTIGQDQKVNDFFELVKDGKYISVPVVDKEGGIVGIITLSDIINLLKIDS